jgi:hypothetical protein
METGLNQCQDRFLRSGIVHLKSKKTTGSEMRQKLNKKKLLNE